MYVLPLQVWESLQEKPAFDVDREACLKWFAKVCVVNAITCTSVTSKAFHLCSLFQMNQTLSQRLPERSSLKMCTKYHLICLLTVDSGCSNVYENVYVEGHNTF